MDEEHPLTTQILAPLDTTMTEFKKLEKMLEDCIDINKSKQNDYVINPNFSPELKQINTEILKIRKKMDSLREKVELDLATNKSV